MQNYLSTHTSAPTDHRIREQQMSAYIEKEIQALPPKMRAVFLLSRKEELSYKEIAERLNTSENNVSKQVNNAIRLLKTKLGVIIVMFLLSQL